MFSIGGVGLAADTTEEVDKGYLTKKTNGLNQLLPEQNQKKTTGQIGNNYFGTQHTIARNITQCGAAIEERQHYADVYVFLNQLLRNHVYYELRAYSIYDYISQIPPEPPLAPQKIPISSERNQLGYGGVGILGYNVYINPNVSFRPFVRFQRLTNTYAHYADSLGNELNSVNYGAFLGGQFSMRVNDNFAIHTQLYGGYSRSLLSGRGLFLTTNHPVVESLISTIEFGFSYNMTKSFSVTPHIQFITIGPNPNQAARDNPYKISQLTGTSSVYTLRFGYQF